MRVRLKGINRAKVKLANGERITYYYATCSRCRGPRMTGNGFVCARPRPGAA
jgi:hypothetical protein